MRILITGGAGFVGSSLCIRLKERYPHYSIIAFDNLKRRGSELNLIELRRRDIDFVHGDIRNPEDLDAVGGFDVLVEASAEPSVLSGLSNKPDYVINNNLTGSVNCFNACLAHKAKIIFLSTSRVYPIQTLEQAAYIETASRFQLSGDQTVEGLSGLGVSEKLNLFGARSFYGATKLASELLIQEYTEFYDLKAAVTRFGVIAGPRQMGKTDQGVVTLWMAKHYWQQSLKYIGFGGEGKQVRDVLHIEDVIDLIDMQIHNIEIFNGRVFNAGGGIENSVSLQELTAHCREITGNSINIEKEVQNRSADLRIYITDNTALTNHCGWKPKHDVRQLLTDVYEWMKRDEKQLEAILK
jgi:CDP-paratose 2-epimerase